MEYEFIKKIKLSFTTTCRYNYLRLNNVLFLFGLNHKNYHELLDYWRFKTINRDIDLLRSNCQRTLSINTCFALFRSLCTKYIHDEAKERKNEKEKKNGKNLN